MNPVRIGIVGLGKNTRKRHVPGFRGIEGVELVSVCNRTEYCRSVKFLDKLATPYLRYELACGVGRNSCVWG